MINLMNEPEILEYDKDEPQILDADNYVSNAHRAVGFASACWTENRVFDTQEAIRIANELCAYIRLLKEGETLRTKPEPNKYHRALRIRRIKENV